LAETIARLAIIKISYKSIDNTNIPTMKKYWKSLEELKDIQDINEQSAQQEPEFSIEGLTQEEVSNKMKSNRRDFLKMLGFSVSTVALASSCETPVRKAIPFLNKPEEVVPGVANHYASTFYDGDDYCPIVVKVRDGRPIKIEGNKLSALTEGGTSARIQASVLSLYDSYSLKHPLKGGQQSDWTTVDNEITGTLSGINASGGKIVILSASVISPSMLKIFEEFKVKYPNTEVVYYDPISYAAMRKANFETFGKDAVMHYNFADAEVIAGFNCDFLGGWLSPVEYALQYAKGRDLTNGKNTISKHYQFESWMSLTGSNADIRHGIKPSDELVVLQNLYNKIAEKSNMQAISVAPSPVNIDQLAEELMSHQTKSLVVSGTNDLHIQTLVNAINFLLGNQDTTLGFERFSNQKRGDDSRFESLVEEMNQGRVEAMLIYGVNPAYDYYNAAKFAEGLKKVKLTVSFGETPDETTKLCTYACPDHHYLESWGDAEPYHGIYSLTQPTIHPIFDTRQAADSLLKWMGNPTDFHTYIKKYWEENLYPKQTEYLTFNDYWNHTLQKGVFEIQLEPYACPLFNFDYLNSLVPAMGSGKSASGIELTLYEKVGIGSGKQANNPWLQELPDPITKAVWDNYLCLSPTWAKENGFAYEDVVKINGSMELPVLLQPGQPYGTASVALGYGRTDGGKVANNLGKNVFMLAGFMNGSKQFNVSGIIIEKTGETYPIATTQTHHSMEGRPLIRETVLGKWQQDPESGNELHRMNEEKAVSLYKKPHYDSFHWELAIDLNKCIGCSACVVACQAENNVAVVGKEEVKKKRIMHWIRIDRYFSTVSPDKFGPEEFLNLEPDNPEVFHQPVMCQHCDNAPCENVCPVAATPHSKEGLNQMAYNRCIGTRYCMNNCPYRVRRFNWHRYTDNDKFDYNFNDQLSKMVLNPDVVVRERGVVEKCSMCVQRIQEKKLVAKNENRQLEDGEINVACAQACPTKAIVFGDTNDKESRVSKLFDNGRRYQLLEELHTLASVGYLTKVRNKDASHETEEHHS
jgi:molybdopterin-containing oxidoreductase family iron-sulfur binding subunit